MKKVITRFAVSALVISMFGVSVPAFADISQEDINRFVTMYDINKDGMVSRVEMMKRAADMLDKMDAGKKGMMDDKKAMAFLLELQKTDSYVAGSMIPKVEIMKKIETAFDKMDAARKGMLDRKQVEALLKELMKSGA